MTYFQCLIGAMEERDRIHQYCILKSRHCETTLKMLQCWQPTISLDGVAWPFLEVSAFRQYFLTSTLSCIHNNKEPMGTDGQKIFQFDFIWFCELKLIIYLVQKLFSNNLTQKQSIDPVFLFQTQTWIQQRWLNRTLHCDLKKSVIWA